MSELTQHIKAHKKLGVGKDFSADCARRTKTGIVTEVNGNLVTIKIPGGAMGANDTLRLSTLFSCPDSNTGSVQAIIRVGGATNNVGAIYFNNTIGDTILSAQHLHNISANNTFTLQKGFNSSDEEAHRESTAAISTSAVDTTQDFNIYINAIIGAVGDVLNLERYTVELMRAPKFSVNTPEFTMVQTIFEAVGTGALWYNFEQSGDYVYAANHTGSVDVIDVSTPSSASIIDTLAADWARDIGITGTILVTIARAAVDGTLKTWDISSPAAIPAALDTHTGTAEKYSALVMDGTDVYVAGQVSGAHKFDVSVPGTIPAPLSNTGGSWETQGVALIGNYVAFANYNNGLRILDKATMGGVTDNTVPQPVSNGDALRIWAVDIVGNYLFATTNVTNAVGNSEERGLAILDLSDPTAIMTADDWIIAPVNPADVDTWNTAGDMPLGGLIHHNDYMFAGNGQKGVAVWNIVDPLNPVYVGLITGQDNGDNITSVGLFTIGGQEHLLFGDGARVVTTDGTDKLYIGELNV